MNYNERVISYADMLRYVKVVVDNAFDENGTFHKYLLDYAETTALLAMYTDYETKASDADGLLNEVLTIKNSEEWQNVIMKKIGTKYDEFHDYVMSEIEQRTKPFAELGESIKAIKDMANQLREVLSAIDIDKLNAIDFTELMNAANAVNMLKASAGKQESNG